MELIRGKTIEMMTYCFSTDQFRYGIDPWKNNMSSFLGFFIEMQLAAAQK